MAEQRPPMLAGPTDRHAMDLHSSGRIGGGVAAPAAGGEATGGLAAAATDAKRSAAADDRRTRTAGETANRIARTSGKNAFRRAASAPGSQGSTEARF